MSIRGILRFYLVFTLVITAGAALRYNQKMNHTVGQYYASVVHALDDYVNEGDFKYEEESNLNAANLLAASRDKNFSNTNTNSDLINFKIEQNVEKSFAEPGDKKAEIMKLIFKTSEGKLNLDHLKFKVYGVEASYIKKVYLYDGDELIAETKNSGDYFELKSIGFELDSENTAELTVKVDLSKKLQPNDRLRLDIERLEDIGMRVSRKGYEINEYYPIKGKYLSIISKK